MAYLRIYRQALRVSAVAVVLAGCVAQSPAASPRFELPQQLRLPQNNLATALERRSGKIAIVDGLGNIVVMDQTGGNARRITRDANARSAGLPAATPQPAQREGSNIVRYQIPVWSPDGARLAISQVTLQPSESGARIGRDVESIVINPGRSGQVLAVDPSGRQRELEIPSAGLTITRPGQVYVLPSAAESEARIVASALYIGAADGKTPLREVTAARGSALPYYDWSPDGLRLAVLSQAQSGTFASTLSLVPADGSASLVVYRGVDAYWDWNHDGSGLINHGLETRASGDEVMGYVGSDGGAMKQVGEKDDFPFFTPHFSPDGQYSLMGARIDNKPALALADATGKPLRALAPLDGLASFSWSPRGALLAYSTRVLSQDGTLKLGALHALDVNTGEDRILSQRPVLAFFWSPDGARIAAIGPADGLTPDAFPGISVITENTAKPYALYVLNAATGAARAVLLFEPTPSFDAVLRRFDRFSRGISFWSPDSLRLVLPVQVDGGSQGSLGFVLEMEASGSVNPRVLSVGGTMATWSPR